jgi:predicted PurR-regulated permease PerM
VEILGEIERQIERFLWARVLISVVVGLAFWLAFAFIGLDEPGVWGLLAALFFSVPFVGPTIMVVAAGIAGFVQFDSLDMAALTAGVALAIAAIEGNLLMPWLMSRAGEMNAVAVFVSLMFWGWLWGVWGLLLAVPITAAIKAVCDRVDDLNGFAEILRE